MVAPTKKRAPCSITIEPRAAFATAPLFLNPGLGVIYAVRYGAAHSAARSAARHWPWTPPGATSQSGSVRTNAVRVSQTQPNQSKQSKQVASACVLAVANARARIARARAHRCPRADFFPRLMVPRAAGRDQRATARCTVCACLPEKQDELAYSILPDEACSPL